MSTIILKDGVYAKNGESLQVGELIFENDHFITLKCKLPLGRTRKECFSKCEIETILNH